MYIRQVKRKCSVRGCKCTDSYAISKTREVGNTVIICKNCLGEGLKAIDEIDPKTKSNIPPVKSTGVPSLFFNSVAKSTADTADTSDAEGVTSDQATTKEAEVDTPSASDDNLTEETATEETTAIVCPKCGKEFGSENGLRAHLRYCKA